MVIQFAVSTAMLVICVMVHGAGLFKVSVTQGFGGFR
jgi:hypothetical protein